MAVLPRSWEWKPLRSIAHCLVSNVDKVLADHEVSIRLCNYTDVYDNEFITAELEFMRATATEAEVEKFRLAIDDVVITKDSESWDDIGVPALVRETGADLVCGYHLAVLRPQPSAIHGPFLLRCLQAQPVRAQLESAASGVTRFGLTKYEIGRLAIPVPPIPRQLAIAGYLDRETARIDALVAAKERTLRLLAEKRRAFITGAVTRGLDPDAPLRDAGISWLGEIPAHWETERAHWLFAERDERSPGGEEELLTVSHITGVTLRSEKNVNMFEAKTREGYKLCRAGDLAINTLWAWMGAMGIACMDGIVSPAYNVYRPLDRLEPMYVDAIVRLPLFAQEVARYSKGVWSSRLRLYPESFFEIRFPVPPRAEQREIVREIAVRNRKLDDFVHAAKRTIDLLKERRAALISAAVSGLIDVEAAA